ncbi:NmrA/HSCARG family protein [Sphingomonas sp. 7/4-4]|uniref:NmrA/HSCARG family protein n=1 Tax=Sphingomonas sp. 7/4-4 TaxID=3018446 RepID=UPI0022F38E54|nr:NmrA/HSCARG family protein [Sphingomonas sp. 7/4-4]WBY09087.1 NmrA/HSCARG family protein [Sphingomonas sp. 7/4-4]
MSPTKPLITIVGALSKQGRSAARSLLESGNYRVRALTRCTDSVEARRLAHDGAELMNVPLEPGQKQAMVTAFEGSHGAFLMTPPIAPPDTHEAALGRELADAAVEAGVQHLVFSSLENVDQITQGEKFAPHFTDKANIENHIRTLPVQSTFIIPAFFYTNLLEYYIPRMDGDTLIFPIYLPEDFRAPFVDPTSATGPAILEIFSHPEKYAGKSMPIVGDILSPREMVATFTRVTGRKAAYSSAYTREGLLHHFPDFAANELFVRELLGMAEYAAEYGYYRPDRDLAWSRKIDPNSLTWEQFLRSTGWQGQAQSFGV